MLKKENQGGKYKLLSNIKLTNRLPDKFSIDHFEIDRTNKVRYISSLIRLLFRLKKYDILLAFNSDVDVMFIVFISKYLLMTKIFVVLFDTLLHRPHDLKSKLLSLAKGTFIKSADKLFVVHKDTSGYQKYYRISKNKFFYVPFKANNYNFLSKYKPKDGGYLLSCGASYRDYNTLLSAVRLYPVPTLIVLPQVNIARYHHTEFSNNNIPEHVKVIFHDFNEETWYEYISNAKAVAVPLLKKAIQPAGISVYLEAMAMGKPVIISEGTSTRGILNEDQAVIIPPEDAESLAHAIKKVWQDEDYRRHIAENGKKYALSLEGEERLVRDILQGVYSFLAKEQAQF